MDKQPDHNQQLPEEQELRSQQVRRLEEPNSHRLGAGRRWHCIEEPLAEEQNNQLAGSVVHRIAEKQEKQDSPVALAVSNRLTAGRHIGAEQARTSSRLDQQRRERTHPCCTDVLLDAEDALDLIPCHYF